MKDGVAPDYILDRFTEALPGVWKTMEKKLRNAKNAGRAWSNVCLLPGVEWEAITSHVTGDGINYDLAPVIAALGGWRLYRGIYMFPQCLRSALIGSKVKGKLPSDTLLRLPEYCPYIDLQGQQLGGPINPSGFWVYIDHVEVNGKFDLKFVLNVSSTQYLSVSIELGEHTILEGLKRVIERSDETWAVKLRRALKLKNPEAIDSMNELVELLQPLVSLVLFLCKEMPEIDCDREPQHRPEYYTPKKTRRGLRWFPAAQSRSWNVETRANERLLDHRRRNGYRKTDHQKIGRRRPPKRHFRGGHWHCIRVGPGRKRLEPRWYSAMWIGGVDQELEDDA